MQGLHWQWPRQNPAYTDFGNANQWSVNAGLASLARETAQNSVDARLGTGRVDLVYTFLRLTGERRAAFERAIGWDSDLLPHLAAMRAVGKGAVTAGQIDAGLEAVRGSPALVLLRVADYGTQGLTGAELADDVEDPSAAGHFVKLCRYDLYSDKAAAAGGSFGLGKAVLWRFSRLQTVLFSSTVLPGAGLDGRHRNRVFGIQQGVSHRHGGSTHEGRGHFGVTTGDPEDPVRSLWADDATVAALHLDREDDRPGTSALILGFYDPDDPGSGLDGRLDLAGLARGLRTGIEDSFWPALTRGRMRVRIDVVDDGVPVSTEEVRAEDTYPGLVHALRAFDAGEVTDELVEPGDVVVRDVPIMVPRRKDPAADPFEHRAKLVVTLSERNGDGLEDRVCLLRRPEMVVETLSVPVEGRTYHALLLAGAAVAPDQPSREDLMADDFLRYAEPPSHDRWIPGTGSRQVSQANLTAHYTPPWRKNLVAIGSSVREALDGLFARELPAPTTAPESVLRHLRFLRGEPGGGGGRGPVGSRKPTVTMDSGWVEDGRWVVDFLVRAQNRPEGWSFMPQLALVGLDGGRETVDWESDLEVLSPDGWTDGRRVAVPTRSGARILKVQVRGVSTSRLPVPAAEAAVEVVLRSLGPAPVEAGR